MDSLLVWIDDNNWVIRVFIVVLVTVTASFIARLLLARANRKIKQTQNYWDDSLLNAGRMPLHGLIWVLGLSVAAEIIDNVSEHTIFEYTTLIRQVAIVLLGVIFLFRFIKEAELHIIEKRGLRDVNADGVTVRVICRLLRVSVVITGALVILQTFGISISGVLAFGGIGGIAVGFAAKDLLANFFGGLMIFMDKPFTIGDWVRSPDRSIEGTVEDIGWRLTKIRTFDKRPLYIPNSMFNTIVVENPSRMTNRRIYETIGLRYCDAAKMKAVVADVKAMLENHEEIDTGQTLIVNFNAMADSSLDFFVYTFTRTTEWVKYHAVKQDVLLRIIDIIHDHNADIAFPTRTLDGLDGQKATDHA